MYLPGEQGALDSVEPPASAPTLHMHQAHDPLLSPSIQRTRGEQIPAFELKFLLQDDFAREVEAWAADRMQRDAYADLRHGGSYQTTTLYLDTELRDVFHRSAGYKSRKYRLRRYGREERLYLERKTRRGDRVSKRRSDVPLRDLHALNAASAPDAWPGDWFHSRIAMRALRPACRITYERTAFVKLSDDGPIRLTLDRRIRGLATNDWDLTPLDDGHNILNGDVICEFKFRGGMPGLFKDVIHTLQLEPGSVSKYRRMMLASGTLGDEGRADA